MASINYWKEGITFTVFRRERIEEKRQKKINKHRLGGICECVVLCFFFHFYSVRVRPFQQNRFFIAVPRWSNLKEFRTFGPAVDCFRVKPMKSKVTRETPEEDTSNNRREVRGETFQCDTNVALILSFVPLPPNDSYKFIYCFFFHTHSVCSIQGRFRHK